MMNPVETTLLFLFASTPFWAILFLTLQRVKRTKAVLRHILDTFETHDSLVYTHMRMYYKNFQPSFLNKRDDSFYYHFNHCRLITNPHELVIVGLGGWNNKRPVTPCIFVKAHVSPHIPVGTDIFICNSIMPQGKDITIEFYDRKRVPGPITLVLKNVDESLRKHLLEVFA